MIRLVDPLYHPRVRVIEPVVSVYMGGMLHSTPSLAPKLGERTRSQVEGHMRTLERL